MTVFKEKKKHVAKPKKDSSNCNTTLETKHLHQLTHLQWIDDYVCEKQRELASLQSELDNTIRAIRELPSSSTTELPHYHQRRVRLLDSIQETESALSNFLRQHHPSGSQLSSGYTHSAPTLVSSSPKSSSVDDYLLKTAPLLFDYFTEADTSTASINTNPVSSSTPAPTVKPNKTKSVLDFFRSTKQPTTTLLSTELSVSTPSPIPAPIPPSLPLVSKTKLLDQYLSIIDRNHIRKMDDVSNEYIDHCRFCQIACIYDTIRSSTICPSCGNEQKVLIESESPSFKEPPREITYFAYKKINHFNEWLSQFQAKESTDIDETVFEKIHEELKKERYLNLGKLKYTKVRDILKKLNLTKYYEHCHYITNRISGRPAPEINEELQEVLRNMFKEIQGPWLKHCPSTRNNFFSYPYIFYKFFQLLGHDDYLPYFRLLKSREKLKDHDEVWKKICEELQWEFIKTV